MSNPRPLKSEEIKALEAAGCRCADWSGVTVREGFDAARVHNVVFAGKVVVGALAGTVSLQGGVELPAELADATIVDCQLGDNVRITRIRGHLANYNIGDGAVVTDVGVMATNPGATFGNGVELEAVNEGGGREVRIFNELSSQIAYLLAMHRYRPALIKKLDAMVSEAIAKVRSDRGTVGAKAVVAHVGEIIDVNIGACAAVNGAARLKNGTVLSEKEAPTVVGSGVVADHFIIAEGASVDSGAVITKVFVGQGSKVGRQFSAENSLIFCNCECFHSEAVAIFAGPYTVTHHRSTLLIAGTYSFYNAGSGTNTSNHMYKLGPVHQGMLSRGSKSGSFSYMMWPCVVSPFSVVIGKHMTNFDTGEFPFSYVTAEEDGSYLTPAMNMFTVGTTRDGQKWPARDRRKGTVKRDIIHFDVYNPYVVARMLDGEAVLGRLAAETPKETKVVRYKGVTIKRLLLKGGAKNYTQGIELYLFGKILERAEKGALAADKGAVYSREWADVSGMLVPRARLHAIEADVEAGKIASIDALQKALAAAAAAYAADEWAWVREIHKARTGKSVEDLTTADLEQMRADHSKLKASFTKKILLDAEKEFDESARMGFGIDGTEADRDADFEAVRGSFEKNSFVKKMQEELEKHSAVNV